MYQKVTQDHKIVTHWLDHLIFISIQNQFLFIFNFSLNVLKMCGYNDISRILGLGVIRRKTGDFILSLLSKLDKIYRTRQKYILKIPPFSL